MRLSRRGVLVSPASSRRNLYSFIGISNVGIGTTAPSYTLDVLGSGYVGIGTIVPSGLLHVMTGDAVNLQGLKVDSDGEVTDIPFRIRANVGGGSAVSDSDTKFIVLGDGNVGIGTAVPGYQLDVWDTAVRGYGTYVDRASHSSLKSGFADVFVLGKIGQLNLKEWQYREPSLCGGDDSRHLSPFADDFYMVFGLGDGPRQIRSGDVAGVALRGVQELTSILDIDESGKVGLLEEFEKTHMYIEQLNKRIKELEAKIRLMELTRR